jgi:hypothetical protein
MKQSGVRPKHIVPNDRHHRVPEGCYFFTVNLLERRGNDLLTRHIDALRDTVRIAHRARPFTIDALRRASRSSSLRVDAAARRRCPLQCDGG